MRAESLVFCRRVHSGFTLIEVMVSLAILAIALMALLFNFTQQGKRVQNLQTLMAEQWVMSNVVNQIQMNERIAESIQTGSVTLFNQNFNWQVSKVPRVDQQLPLYSVSTSPQGHQANAHNLLVAGSQLDFPKKVKRDGKD